MLMNNAPESEFVASCVPLPAQPATSDPFHHNQHANKGATNSLKALADAALVRNTQRNQYATHSQKGEQLITPKTPPLVARKHTEKVTGFPCEVAPPDDLQKVLSWLSFIGETDQEMSAETIQQCRDDPEALAYFLDRAAEVPPKPVQMITCRNCQHFDCFNDHGRGAGSCRAGVMTSSPALWFSTLRSCDQYEAAL
jgi:hypothetical protein